MLRMEVRVILLVCKDFFSFAWPSFGEDVSDLKLRCRHRQRSSFPVVIISSLAISRDIKDRQVAHWKWNQLLVTTTQL